MSADAIARGLALQAKAGAATANAAAAALAALPRDRFDGSIVALGDSITANSIGYILTTAGSDTWYTKGIFTMLVARSGGRLKPVKIAGWPQVAGTSTGSVAQILVARGGSGYSPATTLSFSTSTGGSGTAATPIIQNGVITGATIGAAGSNHASAPQITVTDPGGGTGAVLTPILYGTGQFAVGGLDTQQMEAFIPLILASGARNVLFLGGTNNQPHGIGLADSKSSILSLCQRLTAGGVRVIAIAPLDRDGSTGSAARRQVVALRRWYVDQLAMLVPGVVVVDPSPWITDPNSDATLAGYLSDGLHPSALGADAIAKQVWTQIAPLFPGIGPGMGLSRTWDTYDATYDPQGNLLAQPVTRTGTTVTPGAGEAPWTGTRLSDLYLSRVSGGTGTGTIAASTELRADGRAGTRQVLTVSVTGAVQGETYRLTFLPSGGTGSLASFSVQGGNVLQVGDTVRGAIEELTLSGVAGLRGVKLRLVAGGASAIAPTAAAISPSTLGTAAWGDFEDASFPAFAGDTLYLKTRELVIPAATFGLTMHLDFVVNAGAASFTAKLFGASVRRIS